MNDLLPTMQTTTWTVTKFYNSFIKLLKQASRVSELRLYFYAITDPGWALVRNHVKRWLRSGTMRRIVAYVGTDHGITTPEALSSMIDDNVNVKLLLRYNGIFHPKVAWFVINGGGFILVGSNNLSLDGLKYNIEFATVTKFLKPNQDLNRWHGVIESASVDLTPELLESYKKEREGFGQKRAKANVAGTFTWSKKTGPKSRRGKIRKRGVRLSRRGVLIMEITNRETGLGGKQIQIPIKVANPFFGLPDRKHASITINLRYVVTGERRVLTMTRYVNHTTRLVIHELDYRDRPCVILFLKQGDQRYDFEIVRQSLEPDRYQDILTQCPTSTRIDSRRWGII